MFKSLKIFFFNLFQKTLKVLPSGYACSLSNIRQIIMRRKIKFFHLKDRNLFKVESDFLTMFFNDKMRGLNTYSYGIKDRAMSLANTYNLNLIRFYNEDVFIDCGANYGDLYAWTLINKIKVTIKTMDISKEASYLNLKINPIPINNSTHGNVNAIIFSINKGVTP